MVDANTDDKLTLSVSYPAGPTAHYKLKVEDFSESNDVFEVEQLIEQAFEMGDQGFFMFYDYTYPQTRRVFINTFQAQSIVLGGGNWKP